MSLSEGKRVSPITLFLNQFKDFMVLVLMGATLISGLLGEYLDAITIVVDYCDEWRSWLCTRISSRTFFTCT